jgi:hypothetical protein
MITEPARFVIRYAPAIRGYLRVLLSQPGDVDEVVQEILLLAVDPGFSPDRIQGGRFRDYLIATVRYHAWRHLRRKKAISLSDEHAEQLQAPAEVAPVEAEWLIGWRQCLLDRAWEALECRQRRSPGNWYYSVLELTAKHPDATSAMLAPRVAATPPLSAMAFRKQLSRARRAFAQALIAEIEQTLAKPTLEAVLEELADVGLLAYVQPYLSG